jgi:hypothetical protein
LAAVSRGKRRFEMSTPQLAITHVQESQNTKYVTVNDGFDKLDNADNALVSFANSDADMTLTQAQLASGGAIKITGALTANRHVNLPAIARSFIFVNATTGGYSLIVQVTGAPGATVSASAALGLVELYSDATNVTALTGGSAVLATPVEAEPVTFSGTSGTLAHTPSAASGYTKVKLYRNGMRQAEGGGADWTRSGAAITLAVAAGGSDYFEADYWI